MSPSVVAAAAMLQTVVVEDEPRAAELVPFVEPEVCIPHHWHLEGHHPINHHPHELRAGTKSKSAASGVGSTRPQL
jgi:hypothetical protein